MNKIIESLAWWYHLMNYRTKNKAMVQWKAWGFFQLIAGKDPEGLSSPRPIP